MTPADPILAAACERLGEQNVANIEIRQVAAGRDAAIDAIVELLRSEKCAHACLSTMVGPEAARFIQAEFGSVR